MNDEDGFWERYGCLLAILLSLMMWLGLAGLAYLVLTHR